VAPTSTSALQVSIPGLELRVVSESWDLIGDYVIKVEASLQDYSVIDTASVETNLEILGSCLQPTCVANDLNSCDKNSIEITLDPYLYTIGDDSLNFTPTIVVNP
jgi:hypothetical protein